MIKIRHILFLVLSFILLLSCGENEEKTNWTLKDGHLVIQNDTGMSEWMCFSNTTPEEEWDSILSTIQTITFKNSVTVIQRAAFQDCHNLTHVDMANSVHTIEEWAFDSCTSLKTVHWSKNLKIIEQEAFFGCLLKEICFPNGVQEIHSNAFQENNALKRIILPGSTYEITGLMRLECLEQLVFLGNKPDKITNTPMRRLEYYIDEHPITVYYLNKNKKYWSPNGETDWHGIPIIGIDSLKDLPPVS